MRRSNRGYGNYRGRRTAGDILKYVAIGLAAPQVTYIVQALRKEGIPIDDSLITVKEARDAILRLVGKEPAPETRTPAAPEQEDRK